MSPRFLLDGMLGALTRWLRICGYDSKYLRNISDVELINRAAEEDRILLTRDRLLFRKAIRAGMEAFLVQGESDVDKLASVSRRFKLILDPEKSRCPECDEILISINKEAVRGKVPSRTYEVYAEFWVCNTCGKVYWRGSHWKNILETIEEASLQAEGGS